MKQKLFTGLLFSAFVLSGLSTQADHHDTAQAMPQDEAHLLHNTLKSQFDKVAEIARGMKRKVIEKFGKKENIFSVHVSKKEKAQQASDAAVAIMKKHATKKVSDNMVIEESRKAWAGFKEIADDVAHSLQRWFEEVVHKFKYRKGGHEEKTVNDGVDKHDKYQPDFDADRKKLVHDHEEHMKALQKEVDALAHPKKSEPDHKAAKVSREKMVKASQNFYEQRRQLEQRIQDEITAAPVELHTKRNHRMILSGRISG